MEAPSVLFVCLGNICRSPTAEAIFRRQLEQADLADQIRVDSAGTGDWHIGSAPDSRAQSAALKRGYTMKDLRARQVNIDDFSRFSYIIAMDYTNRDNLLSLANLSPDPIAKQKVSLMLSHHDEASLEEVPDPYYGGGDGFDYVIDLLERACAELLTNIRS